MREEAEGKMLARMLKGENTNTKYENQKNNGILTINRDEYTDEFRRVQEESLRLSEETVSEYHRGVFEEDRERSDDYKKRLGAVYERFLSGRTSGSVERRSLVSPNTKNRFNLLHINGSLFHDIFQINRNYLQNGELVDLHDDYDDCKCFLSDDGLCGFAIESDGNLVSVFSLNPSDRKGFLYAIKDFVREQGASHRMIEASWPSQRPFWRMRRELIGDTQHVMPGHFANVKERAYCQCRLSRIFQ